MTRKTSRPFSLVVVLSIVFFTFVFPPAGLGQQVNTGSGGLEAAGLSFLPVVTYQTSGIGAGAIVAADFNNDGKLDVAAVSGKSIDIFLGNGDGTLKRRLSGITSVILPFGIAVSDLNHDGKSDIVVSGAIPGSEDGAVEIFLGNGDGTFQSPVTYSSGGILPYSVAIADFNLDGNPDIVVTDCSPYTGTPCGLFGILLGNGDGSFRAVVTNNSGGTGAWSVSVADLNADHKPDLIIGNLCFPVDCSGDGAVAVLLGNGDGTFQSPRTYDSGGRTLIPIAADVNGDGTPDILVLNANGNRGLGVLIGNGDGTFRPVVTFPVGEKYTSSLAVADFNNDGKLDAVVSDCGSGQYTCQANGLVSVLLGNGDGTFQAAATFSSGGFYSLGVVIADLNKDGRPDIVVANCSPSNGTCDGSEPGVIGVLLNNTGTSTATSTSLTSSLNPSVVGQAITFRARVTSSAGAPANGETITFHSGASILGTGTLSAGVASFTTSALAAGVYSITASYPGDSTFTPSTSGTLKQTVDSSNRSVTSTSLTSSLNPSIYGQKVALTARVTTSGPIPPTGTVVFIWRYFTQTYTIGSAILNSNGVATLTKSNLNADAYPITAVYRGDINNLSSTSALVNQTVLQTTSAAALASSANPSTVGQAITFSAKITSPTVMPSGPVTFKAGTTVLGTAQLSSGKATFTTSTLSAGSTVVKVTYNGNSNIKGSSSSLTQTVQP